MVHGGWWMVVGWWLDGGRDLNRWCMVADEWLLNGGSLNGCWMLDKVDVRCWMVGGWGILWIRSCAPWPRWQAYTPAR